MRVSGALVFLVSTQVSCHDAPIFRLLLKIAVSLRSSNVTYSIFVWLLATNISSRVPSVALAPVLVGGRCSSSLKRPWLVNLPGWRWATIKQVALDRLSRSLHSDVCDSDGCCDAVLHSTISGRGSRRERAALNISLKPKQVPGRSNCVILICARRVLAAIA